MTTDLSVHVLFNHFQERLALEIFAGKKGLSHIIHAPDPDSTSVSMIGHLNIIHPHRVQVLGDTEISHLANLKKNSRKDTIAQLFSGKSDLVIVGENLEIPEDIGKAAETSGTPLLSSSAPSRVIVNNLYYFFNRKFARKTTLHGVFMEVMGIGVLITGDPSIGKSELALELISRGHRLIADDAPEFSPVAPDLLSGSCPELLVDFLEVRGLGVLNIRAMYGDSVIKTTKYLRLIIYLETMTDEQLLKIDRLRGSHRTRTIQGIEVPEFTLPVAPGRNLAVMVEAAARNHILKLKGYDASQDFVERQQRHIENGLP